MKARKHLCIVHQMMGDKPCPVCVFLEKRAAITKKCKGQIALKKKPKIAAHIDRLYKAVQNYVTKGQGNLIVIGGVEIQEWPSDSPHVFRVAIRCLGTKPTFVKTQSVGHGLKTK